MQSNRSGGAGGSPATSHRPNCVVVPHKVSARTCVLPPLRCDLRRTRDSDLMPYPHHPESECQLDSEHGERNANHDPHADKQNVVQHYRGIPNTTTTVRPTIAIIAITPAIRSRRADERD